MGVTDDKVPQGSTDGATDTDDDFELDDIEFEAPERPQIQLSKRSAALRCGYSAT
jgi:hypothetical protein